MPPVVGGVAAGAAALPARSNSAETVGGGGGVRVGVGLRERGRPQSMAQLHLRPTTLCPTTSTDQQHSVAQLPAAAAAAAAAAAGQLTAKGRTISDPSHGRPMGSPKPLSLNATDDRHGLCSRHVLPLCVPALCSRRVLPLCAAAPTHQPQSSAHPAALRADQPH